MNKSEIIETAILLADAAKDISLDYFRNDKLVVENKDAAAFDPVTQADRKIELRIRELLAQHRPDDGILAEEFDNTEGSSGLTWVIDPIDGTRAFMAGQPSWGTLIAVKDESGPIFGLVDQPYIAERFMGGWGNAILSRGGQSKPLKVRKKTHLNEAILYTTFPEVGSEEERIAFHKVASQVQLVRYGMDCYSYAMLAAGLIDLVIEAGLAPYDILAPAALIQAAGGQVTDWKGGPLNENGRALAFGSKELAEKVIPILNV